MTEAELVGIVTVTYNSSEVLPGFFDSLFKQTHEAFIGFIVDNASQDGSLRKAQEFNDRRIRVIANNENRGVAGGNNQGIRAALDAGCNFILLLNNDTEFESALIEKLVRALVNANVDMVCPKILYFDEPARIWAAGGGFAPRLGYRSFHYGADEYDMGQYDRARLVQYSPTCCVLIHRSVFDRIGFMDEDYFVYMDDVDFMYRAMRAGIKLQYQPGATLLHKVGRLTGGEESAFNIRLNNRNRTYFLLKYFGAVRSLPLLILNHLVYISRLLSGKSSLRVYGIKFRATLEGIGMWSDLRRRKEQACPP